MPNAHPGHCVNSSLLSSLPTASEKSPPAQDSGALLPTVESATQPQALGGQGSRATLMQELPLVWSLRRCHIQRHHSPNQKMPTRQGSRASTVEWLTCNFRSLEHCTAHHSQVPGHWQTPNSLPRRLSKHCPRPGSLKDSAWIPRESGAMGGGHDGATCPGRMMGRGLA